MRICTSLLLASLLALAACSKQNPDSGASREDNAEHVSSTPYPIDQKRSGAILTRYSVIVYFVANSNSVIEVAVPVPQADLAQTQIPLGDSDVASAVLHTGPNVVKYVIPAGASPVPPTDKRPYSQRRATGGLITYSCTTPGSTLPPQCRVTITLDRLDFDSDTVYSIEEQTFSAFSPPP